MKTTDYLPRAAHFDTLLKGNDLIGVEVGVDVGAHAEAMLLVADIRSLYLIDIWDKDFYKGYCAGRLAKYFHKVKFIKDNSLMASQQFKKESLDFIYLDIPQEYQLHLQSLLVWGEKLKVGGIIGVRNALVPNVLKAISEFVAAGEFNILEQCNYHNEIILQK